MDRNGAIETLKAFLENSDNVIVKDAILVLHPELAESKDKKILRKMLEHFKSKTKKTWCNIPVEDIISYLEKQKEYSMSAEEVLIKAGLKPYKDGNKWCILAGDNIQEGICGFGDTIDEALYQFLMEVCDEQKEQKYFWNPTEEDVTFFDKAVTTNTSLTPQERAKLDIIRMKFKHRPNIEQKEQKPADDKAFEEWIDDWWKHNRVNNPDSYDKGDEIQFDEQGFKNFCRRIRNMYQQKPVNWTELNGKDIAKLEVLINNVHNEYPNGIGQESFGDEVLERFREYKGDEDLDEKEQKPAQFKGRSLAKIIKREFEGFRNLLKKKGIDYEPPSTYWESFARLFYSSAREYLKGQKPAEWSKEDESQLNWFYSLLDYIGEEFPVTWGLNEISGKKWLKSLPERLILQPKQEWSKEDEENWKSYIERLESEYHKAPNVVLWDDINWLKSLHERLKSLCPQQEPEWSEEDSERYVSIGTILQVSTLLSKEEYDVDIEWLRELVNAKKYFGYKAKQEWSKEDKEHIESILHRMDVQGAGSPYGKLKEDIIWLKSLLSRPKPSGNWKPSKYMLSLVKKVADGEMLTGAEQMAMGTLHEQLKKLSI